MEPGTRLLIVDDNSVFVETVVAMVDPAEFEVHRAYGAAEALEVAEHARPAIVFLDIVMPDGDGYDVCIGLRRLFKHSPIQIVLMSATRDIERLQKVLDAGADDYMNKPFDELEFQFRLKAAMIRLRTQKHLLDEREFYKQAVRQEEDLTVKLLDRQMGLKESLASLENRREGLERDNTRLAALARYDVLTGLLNRHSLNARLELEIRRAEEEDLDLAGMMIDIDKFKSVNDSFGHLVGDDVLKMVGDDLKKCLRREDFAGRYGGEEFFVILPGSGLDTVMAIAERIRATIEGSSVTLAGARVSVTASIGVALFLRGDSISDWVGRADQAMYRAKQLGRNRVEV